ncbi:F-box protein At4g09920-like [Fagus crenata]
MEDWISQLPDEVLISILSLFTVKEACRTSILSHRWKNLWLFHTRILDFDDPDTMRDLSSKREIANWDRDKFVTRVNHILNLHPALTIDQFRVCFDLNKRSERDIGRWVDFAFSKGVKRFELDFSPAYYCKITRRYTFPHERFTCVKNSICINSLTSLTLKYVHVTGELLEHFLSNCPLLERVHVDSSESIVNLKICGSSLKLKYLHIIDCFQVKSIKIFAPNLESFGYVGNIIELQIDYTPRLLDVYIGGLRHHPVNYAFLALSSYLHQLESLTLGICHYDNINIKLPQFQRLTNLRHLKLKVTVRDEESLFDLISLIEAAPLLRKFTLELFSSELQKEREVRKVINYDPNEHLKEVEIVGFVGRAIDIELVVYLLESAIKLEKIVINPCSPYVVGTPWETEEIENNKVVKECAKQLKKYLPLGAEFVIL